MTDVNREMFKLNSIYYHDNALVVLTVRYDKQNCGFSAQICKDTVITRDISCDKTSRASLARANMTLLQ